MRSSGWCMSVRTRAIFLLVTFRVAREPLDKVDPEPLREFADPYGWYPAAKVGKVLDVLFAGEPAVEGELAGHLRDQGVDRHRVIVGVEAEDACLPARRVDQIEQASDGGGLSGGVGPQEAVDLVAANNKVKIGDASPRAVELGQALGANRHPKGWSCGNQNLPLSELNRRPGSGPYGGALRRAALIAKRISRPAPRTLPPGWPRSKSGPLARTSLRKIRGERPRADHPPGSWTITGRGGIRSGIRVGSWLPQALQGRLQGSLPGRGGCRSGRSRCLRH